MRNPLSDYLTHGWREGRDPNRWFSSDAYLSLHEDVRTAGVNPFVHYIQFGKQEGREISPSVVVEKVEKGSEGAKIAVPLEKKSVNEELAVMRAAFDKKYYLSNSPDLRGASMDLVEHYRVYGWREGRDPAPWFSTCGYLDLHPAVRESGVNPFYHYLTIGREYAFRIRPAQFPYEVPLTSSIHLGNPYLADIVRYSERKAVSKKTVCNGSRLDIHWVVPDFGIGGGGHMTIFRMIRFLELFGHKCTIWINHDRMHPYAAGAYDDVVKFYQAVKAEVLPVSSKLFSLSGDVIFATDWISVYPVLNCGGFREKFYFVQDFEPKFFPTGSESIAAELTYSKDLACICASPWLAQKLTREYGRWCKSFWLAFDTNVYKVNSEKTTGGDPLPRIAVYYRTHTARRASDIIILALAELAKTEKFHVDLFGSDEPVGGLPFRAINHGVLDEKRMAALYNECDIGLCFSTTNYSLVPQEMMACGLPLVELDGESTRAIFPPEVITLAGPDPVDIALKIKNLLNDGPARDHQSRKALEWVSQFSWEFSASMVEAAILTRLEERGWEVDRSPMDAPETSSLRGISPKNQQASRVKVSVVIPTYNPGELLLQLVDMLRKQRLPWEKEIVVIDSSSTDGTAVYCSAQPDILFIQIPKSEFNHGATRNRGIAHSSGEFIALLTQDAVPTDEFWLYNFIILLEHYPEAGGAFGKHYPWPSASPFVQRDLRRHFSQFDNGPLAVDKNTIIDGLDEIRLQQYLYFFSDNNSCLRRKVWEKIPYQEVEYGEDQLWARDILEAGYEKVYSPKSIVYHSHDYNYVENFQRSAIEAEFFLKHFGWKLLDQDPDLAIASQNLYDETWARQNMVTESEILVQNQLNAARFCGNLFGINCALKKKQQFR